MRVDKRNHLSAPGLFPGWTPNEMPTGASLDSPNLHGKVNLSVTRMSNQSGGTLKLIGASPESPNPLREVSR